MTDPILLSGGPKGGEEAEGQGWAQGETRDFDGALYRRDNGQAVFAGEAGQ